MNKTILHLDLDTFFDFRRSDFKTVNWSIGPYTGLVAFSGQRGVGSIAGYETRGLELHSGMAYENGHRNFCPEGYCHKRECRKHTSISDIVTDIIKEHVPSIRKSSSDEFTPI